MGQSTPPLRHPRKRSASQSSRMDSPRNTGRIVLVNITTLAGSNLWRIGLSFVLQLLIANRLGLEGLGQYTTVLAYLNVCQVVSEMGLQTLLIRNLAQKPSLQRTYFFASLWVQVVASLVTWLSLILVASLLPFSETTQIALWLVGGSLPFYAITSVCQMLLQANERMDLVMVVDVLGNTLLIGFSLVALWQGQGVVQLIVILVLIQAIVAGLYLTLLKRNHFLKPLESSPEIEPSHYSRSIKQGTSPQFQLSDILQLWRDALPFYGLALTDVLLHRIDILLLSILGNELIIGLYSAAYNIVRILTKLIQSYWKALYPTLSRLQQQPTPHYQQLIVLSLRYAVIFVLLNAAIGTGIADGVLPMIYGSDAIDAVPIFRILIWTSPVFLIETYAITLLMVERRPLYSLLLTLLHLGTVIFCLPILTTSYQASGAAMAMLIAHIIGFVGSLGLLSRFTISLELTKFIPTMIIVIAVLLISLVPPISWVIRLVFGITLCLLLLRIMRVIIPDDLKAFRRVMTG